MVGPVSDEERDSFARRAKLAFVLLVGLSGGLITLQADVGLVGFTAATGAGLLVGAVLVWIAFPKRQDLRRGDNSDSRRGRR
jgi:membrane associated rhomboid family serine protease